MPRILFKSGVAIVILCAASAVAAQSSVLQATRSDDLRALAARLQAQDLKERERAAKYARQWGIPLRREAPDGRIIELLRVRTDGRPIFYITNNIDSADTISTDEVWPGGAASSR